jgi:hypothetical protein
MNNKKFKKYINRVTKNPNPELHFIDLIHGKALKALKSLKSGKARGLLAFNDGNIYTDEYIESIRKQFYDSIKIPSEHLKLFPDIDVE